MFVLNVAFGNTIMNVVMVGVPLNELMIGSLVILTLTGHLKLPNGSLFCFMYGYFRIAFGCP